MDILQAARLAVMNMMGQRQAMAPNFSDVQSGGSSTADPRALSMMGGYAGDPMQSARLQQMMPVPDTAGMDPEMQALMQGENERLMRARAIYAPQTMGR